MPHQPTENSETSRTSEQPDDQDPDALPSFTEMVLGLADLGAVSVGREWTSQSGSATELAPVIAESIRAELPVEMEFRCGPDGKLLIGCSPPTMYTETSTPPTFHLIRVHLAEVGSD